MTGEELYEEIKAALRYFGLGFSQMDQIKVTFSNGAVQFHYGGRAIEVTPEVD